MVGQGPPPNSQGTSPVHKRFQSMENPRLAERGERVYSQKNHGFAE